MSRRAILVPVVAALTGLVLGTGLGYRLAGAPPPDHALAPAPPGDPSRLEGGSSARDNAELRPATSESVAPHRTAVGAPEETEPRIPEELLATLRDDLGLELLALMASRGSVERTEVVKLVVVAYLKEGDPHAAHRALEAYEYPFSFLHRRVADALRDAGDDGAAALAYHQALALDPRDWRPARELLELDPQLVIETLRAALPDGPVHGKDQIEANLAEALQATGDLAGAHRVVFDALARDETDWRLLGLLGELDPQDAERRLYTLAEETGDVEQYCQLADLLANQGRPEEAANLLLRQIASVPSDVETVDVLYDELAGVAPARAYEHLTASLPEDRVRQEDADRWGNLGEALWEQGDEERAVEAWGRAILAESEDPDTHVDYLRQHAPERIVPLLERRSRANDNDEILGSLGDAYWRAGRHEDALNAWRRASDLDPRDGEWSDKIAAVRTGRDPLDW